MLKELEDISLTECDQIKRTIQDLLRQTCILQVKCDPVTLEKRDNPRYEICVKYQDFLQDYFNMLGMELVHEPQEHIYRLQGTGVPVEKMSLTTTRILLLLKLIYGDKIMGDGLRATVTNMAEIRTYGKDTNLLTRKLTAQEWQEAFSTLRTHQILEIPGAIGNITDDTPLLINRTVLMFCRYSDMNELLVRYQSEDVLEGQQRLKLQGEQGVNRVQEEQTLNESNLEQGEQREEQRKEEEPGGSEENIHASLSE